VSIDATFRGQRPGATRLMDLIQSIRQPVTMCDRCQKVFDLRLIGPLCDDCSRLLDDEEGRVADRIAIALGPAHCENCGSADYIVYGKEAA